MIIAITNSKGGVGKTTTAVNLAAALAAAEKRTLLVDLDPQGNASSGVGLDRNSVGDNIYHVLAKIREIDEVLRSTELEFLTVLPSGVDLAGAEIELVSEDRRESKLKDELARLRNSYDYILIDCPPSLGLLTLNALTAAYSILIPLQCEYYALEGLTALLDTTRLVRKGLNPSLRLEGIVLTMFDGRNNLCRQVSQEVRQHFAGDVFEVVIPRNIRLSEAPSHGKPVILYDATCKGAQSYLALASELIARNEASFEELKKQASGMG